MNDVDLLGRGNIVVKRIQTYEGVMKGISCFFVRQNKVIRDLIVAPELERISWNLRDRYLSLLKKGSFIQP